MFKRVAILFFAVMAAVLGGVALVDVALHGSLTVINPMLLGVFAVIGVVFLLFGIVTMQEKAEDLAGRTDRLTALTSELESFIAALEAANKRLHSSEARYRGLVNAQGDAILRRTPDGRLTYANEGFYRMFGLKAEEVIGTVFRVELHPDFAPSSAPRLSGDRASHDQNIKTVYGYRWIAWEDYAIRDMDGRLMEIQSVGRDITERKALEGALTEARDRAQSANHAKSHFLATMSHEIRTPMNGVLGMARLLLETPLAPDQKTYAEAIRQSGLSLLSLIEDLLDFSKIESGALTLERGEISLRPLIEGVAELLATRAHGKKIDLVVAIAADVPETIPGDTIRLRQVLTNLVGNAIKFTETGGVLISAEVGQENGAAFLRLAVQDTGIGVPQEKQTEIFEEFVQADSSHARRFEGSGLGLAISRRLVEAMGGEIGMSDAGAQGSIFWVRLPLTETARIGTFVLEGRRIAIVSRSELVRRSLRAQIEAAGAECVAAIEVAALSGPCDLVIVDPAFGDSIPDMRSTGVPALALLPPEHRATLSSLRDRGIDGYLTKPLRQSSLEERVLAVLSGNDCKESVIVEPQQGQPGKRGLAVLLAEDNPVNALLARELLRRRGHDVTAVTTGDAAVRACAEHRFDLVIMDLHMPGLDGIEATRQIRAAERSQGKASVPIFALTADALETGRRACQEAGMDGFLTKPVDPADLDAFLAAVSGARAAA
jgi:PAS domain S-box-containing protein